MPAMVAVVEQLRRPTMVCHRTGDLGRGRKAPPAHPPSVSSDTSQEVHIGGPTRVIQLCLCGHLVVGWRLFFCLEQWRGLAAPDVGSAAVLYCTVSVVRHYSGSSTKLLESFQNTQLNHAPIHNSTSCRIVHTSYEQPASPRHCLSYPHRLA